MKGKAVALISLSFGLLLGCGSSQPASPALRAFVSESLFEATVVNSTPVSVCHIAAARAGLERSATTWFPLLRRAGVDSVYVPPNQRFARSGPWVGMNGQLLFQTTNETLNGSPRNPFTTSEWGTPVPTTELVWTGVAPLSQDPDQGLLGLCLDRNSLTIWRSARSEDVGFVGQVNGEGFVWAASGDLPCNERAHLYCFETLRSE